MKPSLPPPLRRLVLGGALLAASLVALAPRMPEVRAGAPDPAQTILLAQADAKVTAEAAREAIREAVQAAREASAAAKEAAREAAQAAKDAEREARRQEAEIDIDLSGEGKRKRGITVNVGGADRQYDSFEQFVEKDPALATMVFGIVFILLLTPVLIVALVVWYKVRKNRMLNETMLRLAEKGIVPPADALQALDSGRAAAMIGASTAGTPLLEQARVLRRHAAWSDLRKGVVMSTIGFALTLYSLFDDATANWLGLVLLFVGIGYIVLWYFEDQQVRSAPRSGPPPSPPGAPSN